MELPSGPEGLSLRWYHYAAPTVAIVGLLIHQPTGPVADFGGAAAWIFGALYHADKTDGELVTTPD
jgi:hypothetical protein